MKHLLRDQSGFTLVEMLVVGLLGSVLLGALGGFMINSLRTGIFTEGQGVTINEVRNAMQTIEKEVRGAEHLDWCSPAGGCIEVTFESRLAPYPSKQARYTHVGAQLLRQERSEDPVTNVWSAWGPSRAVIERVQNSAAQPVFGCDTQSTYLRVVVDLHIEPTPESNPNLNVQTSIRPRNFSSVTTCP